MTPFGIKSISRYDGIKSISTQLKGRAMIGLDLRSHDWIMFFACGGRGRYQPIGVQLLGSDEPPRFLRSTHKCGEL